MDDGELYATAVGKGEKLAPLFNKNIPSSEWQSFDDLADTGWRQTYIGTRVPDSRERRDESKIKMYHDLRLSLDPGHNTFIIWQHTGPGGAAASHNRPTRHYQPTGGYYQCVFNPVAIIATSSESPATMGYDHGIKG